MDRAPTEDTPAASEVTRVIPASLTAFSSFSKTASTTPSSRRMSSSAMPSPGGSDMRTVEPSPWVPDDMASGCYLCGKEFNMVRRRHHCRTCGRVCCDACSSKRIYDKRTCASCWDRIGRKMSGLSRVSNAQEEVATRERDRKSVLFELLEDERFNRRFVVEDGRSVSYSVAGVPDGLPVFLFLGLDSHRYSAVLFEDVARRYGLQLICIDRPGRGKSDPLPPSPPLDGSSRKGHTGDAREAMSRAIEASVVDTVKQMCVKLRIDKAGLIGQSLGALFALGCAREEELKDVLEETTVCLISPWVPLAAPGCNGWLQTTSSIPALASTAGILGGEVMKQVGDMEHGSSGASDKEKVYLQAPYTQDLFKHLSDLKEGKEAVKNELCIALRNSGEDDAKESVAAVLHAVHIWHGRSDTLVPYDAMRWLERQLPSCTSTVVPGATHALIYDKEEMEKVFASLHKSISDARSTARFTARRLRSQLTYAASSIFSAEDHSSTSPGSTSTIKEVKTPKKGSTGQQKGVKDDDQVSGNDGNGGAPSGAASTTAGRPKLTDMLVKTLSSSKKCIDSPGPSAGTPSAHGSGVGSGSGHGSSGHGRSWHGQSSGHGQGNSSSRHGSELTPRCIPEESKLSGLGVSPAKEGSGSRSGMLAGFRKVSHAMSEAFGSEHGSVASSYGGVEGGNEAMLPPPRPPLSKKPPHSVETEISKTESVGGSGVEPAYPSEEGSTGAGSITGGLMRTIDRAVSSMSLGSNGSGHGSVQGSAHGSVQGSAHGSVQGSAHGSVQGSAHGSVGGAVGASRRPSGILFPWPRLDGGEAAEDDVVWDACGKDTWKTRRADSSLSHRADSSAEDDMVEGFRRGLERAFSAVGIGTPRNLSSAANPDTPRAMSTASQATPRGNRALTGDSFRRRWPSLPGVSASTPRALSAAAERNPPRFFGVGGSENAGVSRGRRIGSGEGPLPPLGSRAAGYEAAMTNWPAGKVPGNPAWEEWSPEKKLFAHLVTASCLALIIATW